MFVSRNSCTMTRNVTHSLKITVEKSIDDRFVNLPGRNEFRFSGFYQLDFHFSYYGVYV